MSAGDDDPSFFLIQQMLRNTVRFDAQFRTRFFMNVCLPQRAHILVKKVYDPGLGEESFNPVCCICCVLSQCGAVQLHPLI